MRNRGILLGATLALGLMALAGCDNTQGTSANPETLHETMAYTNGGDSQNTGAGSGMMLKPVQSAGVRMGGDSPSQAIVKGTDDATGDFPSSLTGPGSGVTISHRPAPPSHKPGTGMTPATPGTTAPPASNPGMGVTPPANSGTPAPAPRTPGTGVAPTGPGTTTGTP